MEPYITGLFTDLDRKNCTTTTIAAALTVVDLSGSGGDAHGHELPATGRLHLDTDLALVDPSASHINR